MAGGTPPPRSTTFPYILFFFFLLSFLAPIHGLNITAILSHYPDLSDFSSLLSSTSLISDLSSRSSLTILAVPNSHLHPSSSAAAATSLADVLRYHILLRYLSWSDLRQIPASGTLIPTLYQTTGRAPYNLGSLNFTFDPSNDVVSAQPPISPNSDLNPNSNSSSSSAVLLSLVKSIPYNLSIFRISALISPYGSDLVASETRPPSPGVNITRALIDGHNFNVAASMLYASGVVEEFEADEAGAGITLFVPTDEAFANLPSTVQLQALSADRKALVLKFHVLHSYYPLGSLESIVNPVQPTLATEDNGAGSFTLNISTVNGSVALNSGVVQAVVTQTAFDQNPVAIFGISKVLLPREIFGAMKDRSVNLGMRNGTSRSGGDGAAAAPPMVEAAPEVLPETLSPSSHLSSPPGSRADARSDSGGEPRKGMVGLMCTVGLLYVLGVCDF